VTCKPADKNLCKFIKITLDQQSFDHCSNIIFLTLSAANLSPRCSNVCIYINILKYRKARYEVAFYCKYFIFQFVKWYSIWNHPAKTYSKTEKSILMSVVLTILLTLSRFLLAFKRNWIAQTLFPVFLVWWYYEV